MATLFLYSRVFQIEILCLSSCEFPRLCVKTFLRLGSGPTRTALRTPLVKQPPESCQSGGFLIFSNRSTSLTSQNLFATECNQVILPATIHRLCRYVPHPDALLDLIPVPFQRGASTLPGPVEFTILCCFQNNPDGIIRDFHFLHLHPVQG